MVRIKITCREIKIEDENFGRIPTPKNLESMLVNFTLMVLLTINQVGYFYRTRYCVTRLLTVIKFFQSLEQFFLTVGQIIFWKQNTISFSTNQSEKNLWNKFGKQIGEIICWIRNNNFYLFFSLSNEKLSEYPAWLIVYITQVVFPMIGLAAIALKIELKYGKVLRRDLLGN